MFRYESFILNEILNTPKISS